MSKIAYVYVPRNSITNFTIGIDNGIWGWHSATLDKAQGRETVASSRQATTSCLDIAVPTAASP